MPVFKTFNDDFDFEASTPETETNYAAKCYVYLSRNVLFEEWESEDGDTGETLTPIIESAKYGLMLWCGNQHCWEPAREALQKAYSDFIAEKTVLGDDVKPKTKKK